MKDQEWIRVGDIRFDAESARLWIIQLTDAVNVANKEVWRLRNLREQGRETPTPRMRQIAERVNHCQDSEAAKRELIRHAPSDLAYLLEKLGYGELVGVRPS